MNAPEGVVLNQYPVEIQHHGRIVAGVYSIWADKIAVTAATGAITTAEIGNRRLHLLARIMLRELVQDGRA